MKYAYVENKKILGWYNNDIHDTIPTPNVEVSEELWNHAISNGYNYYDGKVFSYKEPTLTKEEQEANLMALYKSYYLEKFNAKLDELDYDDIATVGVWAIKTGSTFQAEAKALLNWYEAIINKNYEILNAVKKGDREMPSKEEYLSELPLYTTYEI